MDRRFHTGHRREAGHIWRWVLGLQAPLFLTSAMAPALAHGNPLSLLAGDNKPPTGTGWSAFGDVDMLVGFAGALLLASALGWALAWSPRQTRYLERMSGAATSTVMVLYAVVGATIGALVTQYGMGVGLVVFGIGGLTRFRSNVGTPESTGRLIAATLVGLCAGLELPHVAVSATFFVWLVLWLATRRATFRLLVKGLAPEVLLEAANAHRAIMKSSGCEVLGEKKNFLKGQVAFLFRAPQQFDPEQLRRRLQTEVPAEHKGAVDWDIG